MRMRPEPPYRHGTAPTTGVLLCNLGTPDEPTAPALRRYLAEFLSDPRVVEIPKVLWWLILHGIILRVRPAKSAAKYASIWTPEGSPLRVWTLRQAAALATRLNARGHRVSVLPGMRYGHPAIADALDRLKAEGATRILVLPLYPQYSGPTTASVGDAVHAWSRRTRNVPELRFVQRYGDDAGYIAALGERLADHWQRHGRPERLVLSFHGVPRRTLEFGDPYHCECRKTARLLAQHLDLPPGFMEVTFQSRFGRAAWLEPYTEPRLIALATQGVRRVDVFCPGFTADCLETLEEIGQEARDAFLRAGGTTFHHVACLNDQPRWLDALTDLAECHMQGWPTRAEPDIAQLAVQRTDAHALGAAA